MAPKHSRWQASWQVSDDGTVARHASGLRVRLHGEQGQADNAADIELAFLPQHGPHNAPAMVQRLVREGAQMLIDPTARGWRS